MVTPQPVSRQPHRKKTCTAGLLSAPVAHTTGKPFAIISAHQVSTSLMHRVVPHGALARLNLAVSPSAACSPICCAKVPHTIAFLATRPTAVSAPVLVFNHSSYLGKLARITKGAGNMPMSCVSGLFLQGFRPAPTFHFAHRPNCRFNADANIGHAFGIFMPAVGALQPTASGAG